MITLALRAEIRSLHCGEHWTVGIAAVHRETVRATVEHESDGVRRRIPGSEGCAASRVVISTRSRITAVVLQSSKLASSAGS